MIGGVRFELGWVSLATRAQVCAVGKMGLDSVVGVAMRALGYVDIQGAMQSSRTIQNARPML